MLAGETPGCAGCGDYDPVSGKWTPTPEAPFGAWACDNCPRGGLHPYAARILELYLLAKGGYPFGKDDIEMSDRLMMGAVDVALRRRELADAVRAALGEGNEGD